MLKKIIYWAPRIISVLFVLFLSLFSLDVLSNPLNFLALFIHLIPSLILLVTIILAWKWEWVGIVVFLFFALFYIGTVGLGRHWSWYVFISGPAFLVSILFLFSWLQKKRGGKIIQTN